MSDESTKPVWVIRDVNERTKQRIKLFATRHQMTIAEALDYISERLGILDIPLPTPRAGGSIELNASSEPVDAYSIQLSPTGEVAVTTVPETCVSAFERELRLMIRQAVDQALEERLAKRDDA
jgi:hypothetical protein